NAAGTEALQAVASNHSIGDGDAPDLLVAAGFFLLFDGGSRLGRTSDHAQHQPALLVSDAVLTLTDVDQTPHLVIPAVVVPQVDLYPRPGRLVGHVDDLAASGVGDAKVTFAIVVRSPDRAAGRGSLMLHDVGTVRGGRPLDRKQHAALLADEAEPVDAAGNRAL